MKEKGSHNIIGPTNNAFGSTVLRQGVAARHEKSHTIVRKNV
jgi:hypothetical protein